jgi:site-specific DNA-methyltransferase (adenine-specific)
MGDCYGGSGMGMSYAGQTCGPNSILNGKLDKFPKVGHLIGKMDKCMLMMPERIALKMIDEQGWILRNKIKWAKQILNFKEKRTYGSVMPTSVKDRFNESGEELYFFVKNKKYYSDLDAVRLPPQSELNFERPRMGQGNQTIYEQKRAAGIVRQRNYPESKYNKFNYRVRDAKRKAGQPQFKASEEEIKRYQRNKVNDPRGNHLGGPRSWRDFKDENESLTNVAGKNLPTIWLIQSEPHNFQKELGVNTDHFAIFPQSLCEIPIKFGCPPNGIVLDPFMGSGTTAIVSKKLGRNFIGIELNKDYIEIAQKRLNKTQSLL